VKKNFEVRVEGECLYIGKEELCRNVLNLLYDYYQYDKPIPSILMSKQDIIEEGKEICGTEQVYINYCLDPSTNFQYEN